jgi:predicted XRE-type DNA-binding protein
MRNDTLIRAIKTQIQRRSMRQETVANLCGVTQGHFSKVIAGKISPGPKLAHALQEWLRADTDVGKIALLVQRLQAAEPNQRREIIQIMHSISRLVER